MRLGVGRQYMLVGIVWGKIKYLWLYLMWYRGMQYFRVRGQIGYFVVVYLVFLGLCVGCREFRSFYMFFEEEKDIERIIGRVEIWVRKRRLLRVGF